MRTRPKAGPAQGVPQGRVSAIRPAAVVAALASAILLLAAGCSPAWHYNRADRTAAELVAAGQRNAFGEERPFTIERPEDELRRRLLLGQDLPFSGPASLGSQDLEAPRHWPVRPASGPVEPDQPPLVEPLRLTLLDALQVAARHNRGFQAQKERVFQAALDWDLALNNFQTTWAGVLQGLYTADLRPTDDLHGLEGTGVLSASRRLETGAVFTTRLALDLVKLLTLDRSSSFGILADATMTIPLLRGAGRHVVTEPLTQAQRNVVYELFNLERTRQTLAVAIAAEYFGVLQQLDQVDNAAENYRRLIASTQRVRALAVEARVPEIQLLQAQQDELRARDRWIAAQQAYLRRLDTFKLSLGLPADAHVELAREDLDQLAAAAREALAALAERPAPDAVVPTPPPGATRIDPRQVELVPPNPEGGPLEMPAEQAIGLALEHRVDLRVAEERVYDAQRRVVVTADALRAGMSLTGTARAGERRSLGTARLDNAEFRPDWGTYTVGLELNLPLERTAERNAYRSSFVALEAAIRSVQAQEDQVKLEIRNALRSLLQAREGIRIQALAVDLATRRVEGTELLLEVGRAQIRDVLEAQEALISAQNALTAALVNYRVAELELQRDMGVLEIDERGLWREYQLQQ